MIIEQYLAAPSSYNIRLNLVRGATPDKCDRTELEMDSRVLGMHGAMTGLHRSQNKMLRGEEQWLPSSYLGTGLMLDKGKPNLGIVASAAAARTTTRICHLPRASNA